MKYVFRLHARTEEDMSIASKHSKLVEGLASVGGVWGLPSGHYPAPDAGRELSAQFQIGKLLGKGIKGFVNYRFRGGLRDDSDCDDYIDLEFNPKRIEYAELLNAVLPAYIRSFKPYLAYVGDEEFTYVDFDRSRGFNHRNNVLRIHPANYFDSQLCERAFGMSPTDLVSRLAEVVERAEVLNDGALLIVKETPMSMDDAREIDERLRSCLRTDPQV